MMAESRQNLVRAATRGTLALLAFAAGSIHCSSTQYSEADRGLQPQVLERLASELTRFCGFREIAVHPLVDEVNWSWWRTSVKFGDSQVSAAIESTFGDLCDRAIKFEARNQGLIDALPALGVEPLRNHIARQLALESSTKAHFYLIREPSRSVSIWVLDPGGHLRHAGAFSAASRGKGDGEPRMFLPEEEDLVREYLERNGAALVQNLMDGARRLVITYEPALAARENGSFCVSKRDVGLGQLDQQFHNSFRQELSKRVKLEVGRDTLKEYGLERSGEEIRWIKPPSPITAEGCRTLLVTKVAHAEPLPQDSIATAGIVALSVGWLDLDGNTIQEWRPDVPKVFARVPLLVGRDRDTLGLLPDLSLPIEDPTSGAVVCPLRGEDGWLVPRELTRLQEDLRDVLAQQGFDPVKTLPAEIECRPPREGWQVEPILALGASGEVNARVEILHARGHRRTLSLTLPAELRLPAREQIRLTVWLPPNIPNQWTRIRSQLSGFDRYFRLTIATTPEPPLASGTAVVLLPGLAFDASSPVPSDTLRQQLVQAMSADGSTLVEVGHQERGFGALVFAGLLNPGVKSIEDELSLSCSRLANRFPAICHFADRVKVNPPAQQMSLEGPEPFEPVLSAGGNALAVYRPLGEGLALWIGQDLEFPTSELALNFLATHLGAQP